MKIWLSDRIPIEKWERLRGGPDKTTDEEIPHCSKAFNNLPSSNERIVESQNRSLLNMLRVYCSRYMIYWDKYLPQVVGAYNSMQHSTRGISPFMMLTGREKRCPRHSSIRNKEGKRRRLRRM